jgi:hypothetical protein
MTEIFLAFLAFIGLSVFTYKFILDSSFKNNGSVYYNSHLLLFISSLIFAFVCLLKLFNISIDF